MNFQTRYLLYILTLHAGLAGLTFWVLRGQKAWFIAAEVVLGVSLYVAFRIYRRFRQPTEFITSGIEAIQDRDFTVKFVPTGNDAVDELIRVYNLMIDQLRLERTRQAEQQVFLDKLIEAAPIALLILDFDARVAALNPKACQLLGLPNGQSAGTVVGKTLADTGHPLLTQLTGLPLDRPQTVRGAGVETYRVLRGQFIDRGFRRQFLFIEELTTEVIETEKKAYGKVIRMMAHEVNNSIGAVNSILNVVAPDVTDADARRAVQVAIERNDRLNGFMRRFADVVRLPAPHPVPTDLRELIRNVVALMQPQADARAVVLRTRLPEAPVLWPIDVAQMEQVLVNVLKNALDACDPGNQSAGGPTVGPAPSVGPPSRSGVPVGPPSGAVVELQLAGPTLCIRNNGRPIPPDVAVNLFEPFYSTKPTGQGIGLTLTRDILLGHGLAFSLRTEPDGWTAFRIERRATS